MLKFYFGSQLTYAKQTFEKNFKKQFSKLTVVWLKNKYDPFQ